MIKRCFIVFLMIQAGVWAKADEELVRVIDGDTIELKNVGLVRYIGINAPEIRIKDKQTWHYQPELLALKARIKNIDFLKNKTITFQYDKGRKDVYGRTLAYVYADQKMVNVWMLESGLAFVLLIEPNLKYAREMISAQRKAIQSQVGLWASLADGIIQNDQIHRYINRCCQISYTIASSIKYPKYILWKMAGNNSIQVKIYKTRWFFFSENKFSLDQDFEGKTFLLSGYLISKGNYLEMSLDDPYQIQETRKQKT